MESLRRISLKQLASLCRRVGASLTAGIDLRKAMANEVGRGNHTYNLAVGRISQAVDRGESLPSAVADCGAAFPPLMGEMLEAGDQTGHVDAVLLRLAEHYEHLLTLRRIFLVGILWPAIQLVLAIFVIGLLIWVLGFVGTDILGWGMTGTTGLIKYIAIVSLVLGSGWVFVWGTFRGWPWSHAVLRLAHRIPVVSGSLQTIALSQLAWTMSLTFNTHMEALRAMRLAIKSSGHPLYIASTQEIEQAIAAGEPIHRALRLTGHFPVEFADAVQVGEDSGRLAESMDHLADQLRERAEAAFRALTVVAAFCVWGLVATFLIVMIFKLAFFYIGMIEDAASGNF